MIKWHELEDRSKDFINQVREGMPGADAVIGAVRRNGPDPGDEEWVITQTHLIPPRVASLCMYMLADYFVEQNATQEDILTWYANMAIDQMEIVKEARERRARPKLRVIK